MEGVVVLVDPRMPMPYGVAFKGFTGGHDLQGWRRSHEKVLPAGSTEGYWCDEDQLKLLSKNHRNMVSIW